MMYKFSRVIAVAVVVPEFAQSILLKGDSSDDQSSSEEEGRPVCHCGEFMILAKPGSKELEWVDERYQAMGFAATECGACGHVVHFNDEPRWICIRNGAKCRSDLCRGCGRDYAQYYEVKASKSYGSDKMGIDFSSRGELRKVSSRGWAGQHTNLQKYVRREIEEPGFMITKIKSDEREENINSMDDLKRTKSMFANDTNLVFTLRRLRKGDLVEVVNHRTDSNWNGLIGTLVHEKYALQRVVKFELCEAEREFVPLKGRKKKYKVQHGKKGIIVKQDQGNKYQVRITDKNGKHVILKDVSGEHLVAPHSVDTVYDKDLLKNFKWLVRIEKGKQGDRFTEISDAFFGVENVRNWPFGQEVVEVHEPSYRLKKIGITQNEPAASPELFQDEEEVTLMPGLFFDPENGTRTINISVKTKAIIISYDHESRVYTVEAKVGDGDEFIYLEADGENLRRHSETPAETDSIHLEQLPQLSWVESTRWEQPNIPQAPEPTASTSIHIEKLPELSWSETSAYPPEPNQSASSPSAVSPSARRFYRQKIKPDGNCLFTSLSKGWNSGQDGAHVRRQICDFMAVKIGESKEYINNNIYGALPFEAITEDFETDSFRESKLDVKRVMDIGAVKINGSPLAHRKLARQCAKLTKEEFENSDKCKKLFAERYIANMRKPTTWGGNTELDAFGKMQEEVSVQLYDHVSGDRFKEISTAFFGERDRPVINLYYNGSHYDLLADEVSENNQIPGIREQPEQPDENNQIPEQNAKPRYPPVPDHICNNESSVDLVNWLSTGELYDWMNMLKLIDHYENAVKWCYDNGASSMDEIREEDNIPEFSDALGLTRAETKRIETGVVEDDSDTDTDTESAFLPDRSVFQKLLVVSDDLEDSLMNDHPDLLDWLKKRELAIWLANLSIMDYYEKAIEWCIENGAGANLDEILDSETLADFVDELDLKKFQRQRVENDPDVQRVKNDPSDTDVIVTKDSSSDTGYICTTEQWLENMGELKKWMTECQIMKYYDDAVTFCQENGVVSIDELDQAKDDFATAVGMTKSERRRLNKEASPTGEWISSGELQEWMNKMSIGKGFFEKAVDWAEDNGITSMDEIRENYKEFCTAIKLKKLQINRIEKDCKRCPIETWLATQEFHLWMTEMNLVKTYGDAGVAFCKTHNITSIKEEHGKVSIEEKNKEFCEELGLRKIPVTRLKRYFAQSESSSAISDATSESKDSD